MFINRSLPEIDVLSAPIASSHQRISFTDTPDDRMKYETLKRITAWGERAERAVDVPTVTLLKTADLLQLLDLLNIPKETVGKDSGILIPFDFADLNLGLFVFWGERNPTREKQSPESDRLRGGVASVYFFLKRFLEREYAIVPEVTYLPSYYAAHWNRAAILFADIRNFTPLSEILRNTYARPERQETKVFRDILNQHCQEIARIIQQNGQGRIDRFFGPGVMAIFGEHESNPAKAATSAVYAATQMVQRFQTLKLGFMEIAFGEGYETEYNESVGIELGVGIDFGTVLFEYLGDDLHREYTVIGDHVNFAKKLEHEAMQVDRMGQQRPPILISPTVERCTRPWLKRRKSISIQEEEKGFTYRVYGLDPEDVDCTLFRKCRATGDWVTPWEDAGLSPPT